MANDVVVRLSGITKRFGPVEVLSDVDFELQRGEVHGLVGENGAGKSTLMNVLYGLVEHDEGRSGSGCSAGQCLHQYRQEAGVALIPQKLQMLPNLSVAENIFINNWPGTSNSGLFPGSRWKRKPESSS